MHGTVESAGALAQAIATQLPSDFPGEMVLCPPFIHLPHILNVCKDEGIIVGGQTCTQHPLGAYTGEIAPEMLLDLGCQYVLIGHSERRQYCHETDAVVADKLVRVIQTGLTPILCVGESYAQRQSNLTEKTLATQLKAVLDRFTDLSVLNQMVIAYEPVWAIGTGLSATPEQAQAAHAFIRTQVANHDEALAEALRIIYGGSVKPETAGALFECEDVDGVLVGGASLDAQAFLTISSYAEASVCKN